MDVKNRGNNIMAYLDMVKAVSVRRQIEVCRARQKYCLAAMCVLVPVAVFTVGMAIFTALLGK